MDGIRTPIQVRSIVENQTLEINEYFRYRGTINASGEPKIVSPIGGEKDGLHAGNSVPNGIRLEGPVSANPIGVHESWDRPAVYVSAVQRKWRSFNLGEFVKEGESMEFGAVIDFSRHGTLKHHSKNLRQVDKTRDTCPRPAA